MENALAEHFNDSVSFRTQLLCSRAGLRGAIAPGPPEKGSLPISDKKFFNGVLKKKTPSVSNLIKLSLKSLEGH